MDRLHLIAEIFSRPALWDLQCEEYKCRMTIPTMWKEVAASMGPNVSVNECKRKWKNLRDAYRAEIKRIEVRIERDLLKGTYDPKNDYSSKWAYFEHLKFIKDIKRPRRSKMKEDMNASSNDNNDDNDELEQFSELHDTDSIKLEPEDETITQPFSVEKEDDDDNDCQLYCDNILKKLRKEQQTKAEQSPQPSVATALKPSGTQKYTESKPASAHCKCSKRSHEQVHFLEDLAKEEQTLIKSMRLDTTHSSDFAHAGDPDYNFLISFLPQIKKMNELQNLKFRAKMSDFMFSIMSQPMNSNLKPI